MATVEEIADEYDFLKHFEGGREGIRERFAELIKKGFEGYSNSEKADVFWDAGVKKQQVRDFFKGDYSCINGDTIMEFIRILNLNYNEGLGMPNISDKDRSELSRRIRGKVVGQALSPDPNENSKNNLYSYVTVEALKQL